MCACACLSLYVCVCIEKEAEWCSVRLSVVDGSDGVRTLLNEVKSEHKQQQ